MGPEYEILVIMVIYFIQDHLDQHWARRVVHDSSLSGAEYMSAILDGHPRPCLDLFRMEQAVFKALVKEFRDEGWLKDTNNVFVEEQVGIFLLIVGHNARNRVCQDRFQHSGETISRYFRKVLKACLKLSERIIQPPDFSQTPDQILNSSRFYPAFKDCIGALDGTLVHAIIDRDNQVPYRG
ncbi:hypothetical protein QJS04_geneDACA024823 [Acorus gramineus]|uniref:DUF8040 domain-containing protein n=1 Tax=Acorus gramineus TaxID=55184 RepID=A0AAV9A289_ACOGR|nr:hypothetical protein QJS04_geneDACA024823 [Acorus gramineus]